MFTMTSIKKRYPKAVGGLKHWADKAKGNLAARGGFTLTEVLATVIVIGLVSAGLATAISTGTRQFTRSMALSESQQLFSSLRQDIDNDLRYSPQYLEGADSSDVVGYATLHHGDKTKSLFLKALDESGAVVEASSGSVTGVGQLALCSADETVKNRLLGSGAYNYGLAARVNSFKYDSDAGEYIINLEIRQTSLNESLVNETFTVRALNGASPDPEQ